MSRVSHRTKQELGRYSRLFALSEDLKNRNKGALDKNNWYTIENLFFESGSGNIKPGSATAMRNLAALIAAYPTAIIKLGGYTDNTGNAADNQKLSTARAAAAKQALVAASISRRWLNILYKMQPSLFAHLECIPRLLIGRCILKSRMNLEVHVRFCEEQGVKIPLLTRL